MITALVVIMCLLTVCWIVSFTINVVGEDSPTCRDLSLQWFIISSLLAYFAFWMIIGYNVSESKLVKPVDKVEVTK